MSTDIYGPIQDPHPPINNKYYKWYTSITEKASLHINYKDDILEEHHIIPKSFFIYINKTGWLEGNPNRKINLVLLTPKEHIICHKLLTKCYENGAYLKMVRAFNRMSNGNKGSRHYNIAAKLHSEAMKGENNPRYGSNGCEGYHHTQEYLDYMSERMTGEKHPNYGKIHSPESNEKRRQKQLGVKKPPKTDIQKQKISEAKSQDWLVTNPNGEKFVITNLFKFSSANSLTPELMWAVAKGKQKHHKGWKCEKLT